MHAFLSIFNSSILAGSSQALKDREHILNRNMGIVREGLAAAEDFFSRKHSDKFSWRRPIAGSVAFPGLKPRAWERLSPSLSGADRFCAHLREHADLEATDIGRPGRLGVTCILFMNRLEAPIGRLGGGPRGYGH